VHGISINFVHNLIFLYKPRNIHFAGKVPFLIID
jgi:hypothetical protein